MWRGDTTIAGPRGRGIAAGLLAAIALLGLVVLASPVRADVDRDTRPGQPSETAGRPIAREPAAPDGDGGPRPLPTKVESIPTYDVLLVIRPSGVLSVRETITYDFPSAGEHGIVRRVPYRVGDRLYAIRQVRASSSTGAPARVDAVTFLHDVQIRVGDNGRRAPGRQAYVIEYEVTGPFTVHNGHVDLMWDAIGMGWGVPIGEAAVRVEGPVPLRRVGCLAGRGQATTRCGKDRDGRYAIDFTQRGLRPREGMTIRAKLPMAAIRVPPPQYARPHLDGSWPGMLVLAGSGVLAGLMWRRPAAASGGVGAVLLAVGGCLTVYDVLDDIIERGLWAASIGDSLLVGASSLMIGAAVVRTARRRRAPDTRAGAARTGIKWIGTAR